MFLCILASFVMSNLQQKVLILSFPKLWHNINSVALITCDIMSKYITCVHVSQNGETPIHRAAANGHHEAVKILADLGAPVDATDKVS